MIFLKERLGVASALDSVSDKEMSFFRASRSLGGSTFRLLSSTGPGSICSSTIRYSCSTVTRSPSNSTDRLPYGTAASSATGLFPPVSAQPITR